MCGRLMDEHIDENTGKPFDIQLCSGVCIGAAWRKERAKQWNIIIR